MGKFWLGPHAGPDPLAHLDWKDVHGYPGYEATACGKHVRKKGAHVCLAQHAKGQYLAVTVRNKEGKQVSLYVHRAVALAHKWQLKQPGQKAVDHENRDPRDNRAENLRWATTRENNANRVFKKYEVRRPPSCGLAHAPDRRARQASTLKPSTLCGARCPSTRWTPSPVR